jgi:hypothetical protein
MTLVYPSLAFMDDVNIADMVAKEGVDWQHSLASSVTSSADDDNLPSPPDLNVLDPSDSVRL